MKSFTVLENSSTNSPYKKELKVGPFYIFNKVLGHGATAICKLGCYIANE